MATVIVPSRERADCSVRALAAAAGYPYETAAKVVAAWGRKSRASMPWSKWVPGMLRNGFEMAPEAAGVTVETALKALPAGRYVFRVPRHVFAVVDGVAHDHKPVNPRQRVKMAYRRIESV